jgi:NADH-quinone oxidoreductase subunit N
MIAALNVLGASTATRIATPKVDWRALAPIVILLVGGIVVLTIASLTRKRPTTRWYAPFTVVVAIAAGLSVLPVWARVQGWDKLGWITMPKSPRGPFSTVAGMVGVDGFGLFVAVAVCAAVVLGALLAGSYLRREELNGPEFFALLLLAGAGGVIMAMADDFIVLFLGLETLSLAVYVLAAMHLRRAQSQEAGMKYFVLGAFSSAFLLYGIALIYGATGSTNFIHIKDFFGSSTTVAGVAPGNVPMHDGLLLMGLVLVLVGLGFKVAAVPFHSWSPDVYDGSPTPAVAFMAGAVKAAAFAAFIRVFVLTFPNYVNDWRPILWVLATLSLLLGAVLAIVQTNVKRMLAYSSINHAGFILIAVSAASAAGTSAVLFYVATYIFVVAGSFAVVGVVAGKGDGRTTLADYRGLARSNPVLAGALTVFLLSQAGIPFTAGFFAKFLAVDAVLDNHTYWLAIVAMLSSAIAAFLYLRLVVFMYLSDDDEAPAIPRRIRVPLGTKVAITLCLLVTIGVGIMPELFDGPADQGIPYLVQPPAPTAAPVGK